MVLLNLEQLDAVSLTDNSSCGHCKIQRGRKMKADLILVQLQTDVPAEKWCVGVILSETLTPCTPSSVSELRAPCEPCQ